jgi:hypothetical protein
MCEVNDVCVIQVPLVSPPGPSAVRLLDTFRYTDHQRSPMMPCCCSSEADLSPQSASVVDASTILKQAYSGIIRSHSISRL